MRLHLHIIDSFITSSGWLHNIIEHGSPDFHLGAVRCFEALLLAGLVIFSVSWKRLTFVELGLLIFWTHLALYSVRHIPLYVLVVVPILVRHCTMVLENGEVDPTAQSWIQKVAKGINRYSQKLVQIEKRFDTALYTKVAVLVMIGLCLNGGRLGGHQLLDFRFDENRFPVRASEFVERQNLQGNLFTSDLWAGYLIYRNPRRYKVFFDGRSDMYGESFMKEYLDLSALNYNWKDVLKKYRIAWILVPADSSLATVLGETAEWKLAYHDQWQGSSRGAVNDRNCGYLSFSAMKSRMDWGRLRSREAIGEENLKSQSGIVGRLTQELPGHVLWISVFAKAFERPNSSKRLPRRFRGTSYCGQRGVLRR